MTTFVAVESWEGVLGIVRGTLLGDIKTVGDLGTTYGIELLIGLVAAVATLAGARGSSVRPRRGS